MTVYFIRHKRNQQLYLGRAGSTPTVRNFPWFCANAKDCFELLSTPPTPASDMFLIAEDWEVCWAIIAKNDISIVEGV